MCRQNVFFAAAACLAAFSICADANQKRSNTIELFSAAAETDWTMVAKESKVGPSAIYEHRDNVLVIKAGPKGYLRTKKSYTNFALELEWRRPEGKQPGRGGILIRATGQDQIWPKSLEAQLNAGGVGDFWGLNGYRLAGPAERFEQIEHDQFGTLRNLAKIENAEKPVGQWNTYEVIAKGGEVTLKINDHVVNQATDCDIVAGTICLTAEGDEIHFRNVRLTPLPN
jgi:hypothetical protein